MRLTADMILRAQAYINPLKERELNLRGYKIPLIENMGATMDQFDTLELSDNEICKLNNFPHLKRLKTILLNNNMIDHISNDLFKSLPNLENLILTNNKITHLHELDALSSLKSLKTLSLLDNLVTKKQYYRLYVIYKMADTNLKMLDFNKITSQERSMAKQLFEQSTSGKAMEKDIEIEMKMKENFENQQRQEQQKKQKNSNDVLTEKQKFDIISAIQNASTPEEVDRLERMLKAGKIPTAISSPSPSPSPIETSIETTTTTTPIETPRPIETPIETPIEKSSTTTTTTTTTIIDNCNSNSNNDSNDMDVEDNNNNNNNSKDVIVAPAPAPIPEPKTKAVKVVKEPEVVIEDPQEVLEEPEVSMEDSLTIAVVDAMKVVELKKELMKRNLPTNGLKSELAKRLKANACT